MLRNGERVYEKSSAGARKTAPVTKTQGTGAIKHMSDRMRDKRTSAPGSACPARFRMRQYINEF